jgi:hypothetical protein
LLAPTAAVRFGVSTPRVQRFGADIGSLATAAFLYAGAALIGAMLRRPAEREARVQRRDAPKLGLMALFGAAIGPVAPALARLWHHETLDRRVILAMALLTLGGRGIGATFAQDAAPIAPTLTPSANGPLGVSFQREVSGLFLGTFSLTPSNVGGTVTVTLIPSSG